MSENELRTCTQFLYSKLEDYATQRFGSSVKVAGWKSFSRWGVAAVTHEEETYQFAFIAWYLFSWLPDDYDLIDEKFLVTAPDHAIATDYLKSQPGKLNSLEKKVIRLAASSPYSFYVVLSTHLDNHIRIQDIYTKKIVLVEVDGQTDYAIGDVLFSAVLSIDGVSILLGCMPFPLAANCLEKIENHRKKWRADVGKAIDRRLLYLHDTELRRFYFLLLSQTNGVDLH